MSTARPGPDSLPDSQTQALVPVIPMESTWHPILHRSNQVVLYNPTSHALAIRHAPPAPPSVCPYCNRPLLQQQPDSPRLHIHGGEPLESDSEAHSTRASNYFQLLAIANETSSRPSTPPLHPHRTVSDDQGRRSSSAFPAEAMAEGYFQAFFQEECRLGMGANGSVFLCQVCVYACLYSLWDRSDRLRSMS